MRQKETVSVIVDLTIGLIPGAAIFDKKGRKMRRKETVSVTVDLPEDPGLPLSA